MRDTPSALCASWTGASGAGRTVREAHCLQAGERAQTVLRMRNCELCIVSACAAATALQCVVVLQQVRLIDLPITHSAATDAGSPVRHPPGDKRSSSDYVMSVVLRGCMALPGEGQETRRGALITTHTPHGPADSNGYTPNRVSDEQSGDVLAPSTEGGRHGP